jgi:hypothetical protein
MKIPQRTLRPSTRTPFHGVILVKEVVPHRHVYLHITFGEQDNFLKEPFIFEVVDYPGTYHVFLGWPCFPKLLAILYTPTLS